MVKIQKSQEVISSQDEPMVRVEGVSKSFGRIKAVEGISFSVKKGEILGFLGPNGAGKTTTVRMLTGFFPPSAGKIWIDGEELYRDPRSVKTKIGYLPETISMYGDMRIVEFLNFVAKVRNVPRRKRKAHLEEKLVRCGIWDVRDRAIKNLSKGYRQRTGLAQALVGDPEVLVFDEPTNGLDPKQNIEIRTLIRELGRERTLILSSHVLPEVSMVCDRVLIMNQGRIVASGTAAELEASIKKRQNINVIIGNPHCKDQALKMLEDQADVERVTVTGESADQITFSLLVKEGSDLRAEISRLFVQHDIPLLEMRAGRLSLEEIFMKIVLSESKEQTFI